MLQFYIPEVKSVEQVIVGIKSYPHGFRNSIEKATETCKSPCRKVASFPGSPLSLLRRGEPESLGNEIFSHYNAISETGTRLNYNSILCQLFW